MPRFEYHVIPAPKKGEKARGAKSTADRFAHALTGVMNKMGADGWDYLRADTLPCDERVGLTGSKTVFQHMLVFRREVAVAVQDAPPVTMDSGPPLSLRHEPTLSPIPAARFANPEPSEVVVMEALAKRDIPPQGNAD